MRLIDADKLKRKVQRIATEAWKMKLTANIETTLNQFIDYINEASTIEIPTWIPCSERLPEEHEWIGTKTFGTTISDKVLVTFDVDGTRLVKPLSLQNGKLSRPDAQTMDAIYKGWQMLAWMPLPEPYEPYGEEFDE